MKIEHVAIWCRDIEVLKSFYTRYFRAKAGEMYVNELKNFKSYFLSFPEGCRLEIMQMPGITDRENGYAQYMGIAHLAVSVGSRAAVDQLTNTLREDGYEIAGEPRTTGDGYYESVVLDPEGNRIELTE